MIYKLICAAVVVAVCFPMPIDSKARKVVQDRYNSNGLAGLLIGAVKDVVYTVNVAGKGLQAADMVKENTMDESRQIDQDLSTISKYGSPSQRRRAAELADSNIRGVFGEAKRRELEQIRTAALKSKTITSDDGLITATLTGGGGTTSSAVVESPEAASPSQKAQRAAGSGYDGPCPYMTRGGIPLLDSRGNPCGRRAASIRPGGFGG